MAEKRFAVFQPSRNALFRTWVQFQRFDKEIEGPLFESGRRTSAVPGSCAHEEDL